MEQLPLPRRGGGHSVQPWSTVYAGCVDVDEGLNPAPTPDEVYRYFRTLPLPPARHDRATSRARPGRPARRLRHRRPHHPDLRPHHPQLRRPHHRDRHHLHLAHRRRHRPHHHQPRRPLARHHRRPHLPVGHLHQLAHHHLDRDLHRRHRPSDRRPRQRHHDRPCHHLHGRAGPPRPHQPLQLRSGAGGSLPRACALPRGLGRAQTRSRTVGAGPGAARAWTRGRRAILRRLSLSSRSGTSTPRWSGTPRSSGSTPTPTRDPTGSATPRPRRGVAAPDRGVRPRPDLRRGGRSTSTWTTPTRCGRSGQTPGSKDGSRRRTTRLTDSASSPTSTPTSAGPAGGLTLAAAADG